jgi:hypothetical protein
MARQAEMNHPTLGELANPKIRLADDLEATTLLRAIDASRSGFALTEFHFLMIVSDAPCAERRTVRPARRDEG